jgi:hypothetical protein
VAAAARPLVHFVAKRFGRRILERHLSHNVRDPGRATEMAAMIRDSYAFEGADLDNIEAVMIAGQWRKRDHALVGADVDVAAVKNALPQSGERLLALMNPPVQ